MQNLTSIMIIRNRIDKKIEKAALNLEEKKPTRFFSTKIWTNLW